MNSQVPNCRKRVFSCLECDEKDECKEWNAILENERIIAEGMLEEMPLIIKYFGVCGLRKGTIENWKKKLAEMSFGC